MPQTDKTQVDGAICGPSVPELGSVVPMTRLLHDDGFGDCSVRVRGLYGQDKERYFCSFRAYPSLRWEPLLYPSRSLGWLEKRIKTWDAVWPAAQWRVLLVWPWQAEEWVRAKPGRWVVTKTGNGII